MAEPSPRSDADQGTPPRMPRWVKIAAIIVGLLVLLFVVLQLTGVGGEHGPGRHMSGAATPTVGAPAVEDSPAALLG
jgi:hypothetical protein